MGSGRPRSASETLGKRGVAPVLSSVEKETFPTYNPGTHDPKVDLPDSDPTVASVTLL